nr:uncharacterized protein LOC129381774 [Dermacentor andersoni]
MTAPFLTQSHAFFQEPRKRRRKRRRRARANVLSRLCWRSRSQPRLRSVSSSRRKEWKDTTTVMSDATGGLTLLHVPVLPSTAAASGGETTTRDPWPVETRPLVQEDTCPLDSGLLGLEATLLPQQACRWELRTLAGDQSDGQAPRRRSWGRPRAYPRQAGQHHSHLEEDRRVRCSGQGCVLGVLPAVNNCG